MNEIVTGVVRADRARAESTKGGRAAARVAAEFALLREQDNLRRDGCGRPDNVGVRPAEPVVLRWPRHRI